ncbi:beta-galactosidase GalB [Actomonas aquatica]|uniref:Beta-galactosidase GalB n=1 Tax=Actomonas aquatica TaxID=2866162 RepID=A0ABZ1C6S1_9BACT|nr:beta-galactosidase GalB [Opitutus sp. WL0086]WRQ86229.1 beta-galactosidase GalB [Opitutus sp. WL0086]
MAVRRRFPRLALVLSFVCTAIAVSSVAAAPRERLSINDGWRFYKYASTAEADALIYDVRPDDSAARDDRPADEKPTEAVAIEVHQQVLKPWILPSGNAFIKDPAQRHTRPEGDPGADFPFVQDDFDDSAWEAVTLPHDWAIAGPFYAGDPAPVGGGMGRLPSPGVAWYRRDLVIPASDAGRTITLEIDGAMSYSMVWLNGHLVGGWPFGYTTYHLDLTPYVNFGGANQLAIRLDNPPNSSRWYPGGGLYRNVWLTKTNPVQVAQWGTFITTRDVSAEAATIDLELVVQNNGDAEETVTAETSIEFQGGVVARFPDRETKVGAGAKQRLATTVELENPRRWGPPPNQVPHLYRAITTLRRGGQVVDTYETRFGIRTLEFHPTKGLFVNGEHITFQGVNQHHDLGALGAAFNVRAAERQLELLREAGVNAIRLAHNPPAPELLELTDRMGFLVINESFDAWERKKPPLDFHLIFPDWSEPDMRALVRRDRNSPSVIMWSTGNEVGEQYTGEAGAAVAQRLHDITKDEDPTRPTAASFNFAKPHMPILRVMDAITLNYQGEGIRNAPAYAHLKGINTPPLYPAFHDAFPAKMIISSENAAAVSSRGEYLFPVTSGISAPVEDGQGGDPVAMHVSAYELYTAPFGSSADKVLGSLARHPYVAGGFVWSGWDYLGEPTPYYGARSSYFGIIDLAGFPKDRFYLYQAAWRPHYPMVHVLPHWNWPDRVGQITPVHVFTTGDEAELFLNGESLGRKTKGEFEYRLRWDDVVYEPGEIKVVAYKHGTKWAEQTVKTTGPAAALSAEPDRATIAADGQDLSFVTVRVLDADGEFIRNAKPELRFSISGPGEIVATDNGDPTDLTAFPSLQRRAFNGLALAIVRGQPGEPGEITVTVEGDGLTAGRAVIATQE